MLEKEIASRNEHCRYTDEEKFVMKHLLEERRNVLWLLNAYDDETKQLLFDFNDALRKACTQLYHQTMSLYREYLHRENCPEDFAVGRKIFLSYEYPALHPIQTETAKQVWDALSYDGFCTLYDDGCAWPLRVSRDYPLEHSGRETLDKWLGMDTRLSKAVYYMSVRSWRVAHCAYLLITSLCL